MNDTVIEIIKSLEGRNELWQWDTGRQIKITPGENAIVDEIHFSNAYSKDALVVKPQVNEQGNIVADIPNILLWQVFPINVYVVMEFPNGKGTIYEEQLKIKPRKKPSDYVYTETEILNYLDLEKRIKALEESCTGGGIAKETDPTVPQWAKEPTKPSYTAKEVGAPTKEEFNNLSEDVGNLSEDIADLKENGTGTGGGATADQLAQIEQNKNDIRNLSERIAKSSGGVQTYVAESIGELFEQPSGNTYLAWPAGNLKYDSSINKYVCIINVADKHIFTTLKPYICYINPETYETSEVTEIVVNNTTLDQKAICNFIILNDGTYMFIALIGNKNHKITSTDKGVTWVDNGEIIGNSQHFWAIYKLSSGRLIGSIDVANCGLWYSDNDGNSWTNVKPSGALGDYNAEGCIIELSENNLMCVARKNMSGVGVSASGDSDNAIISYSNDNGTTWSAWQESTCISMNASVCTAIVHDGLVEIFANNRWYHRGGYACNEYTNTGKNGALIHYTATIENALKDNFTNNGVVVYANTPSDKSDTAQDFHSPCVATNGKEMLLVYFDRVAPYTTDSTNYFFVRGSLNGLKYPTHNEISSKIFAYSGSHIDKLLRQQYTKLMTKINEIVINGGGTPDTGDDPENPTSYVFDGIIMNFDYLNYGKYDVEKMTLTDTINGVVGTFKKSHSTAESATVSELPILRENSISKSWLCIPENTLSKFVTEEDYELSFEISMYAYDGDDDTLWNNTCIPFFSNGGGAPSFRIASNGINPYYQITDGTYSSGNEMSNRFPMLLKLNGVNLRKNELLHAIVTIASDGMVSFYSNGELLLSEKISSTFVRWGETLLTRGFFIDGYYKAMRIYKRALTAEEVLNNYNYELQSIV